jgi:rod shape-determining protein MreD
VKTSFWTLGGLFVALLVESALGRIAPSGARLFDPFLLVFVYCALTWGETHGMLAGVAAGWVQDIHFGGGILGLSGLTDVLLGFVVGLAGARFLLVGTTSRLLVLFGATLAQSLVLERCASLFEIPVHTLSLPGLLIRSGATSIVGALVFELLDARRRAAALR